MTFSTVTFVLFFLPAVLLLYFLCPPKWKGARNGILLAASVFFYAWGEPVNVFLILLCTGLTWLLSKPVEQRKKWALFLSVAVNLLPLAIYKYTDFFLDNINRLPGIAIPLLGLALPAGISFYTFQVITYIVDLYRKRVKRQKNLAYLALYIFYFPQLIAGPIIRYIDIEEQIENRTSDWEGCFEGMRRFGIGLAKKMLVANQAGMAADAIAGLSSHEIGTGLSWVWAIAFGVQILFDFSGYSDMAIGIARIFGFRFSENFDKPYHSVSITEFWRRWHISLSSFFRDYVYIPLGGSRVAKGRHIFNLFTVWFLTGLWHGAYWNYAFWGIYYFLLLTGEKFLYGKPLDKLPYIVKRSLTFLAYMLGWGIFLYESNSIREIALHFLKFFGFSFGSGGMTVSQLQIQGNLLIVAAGLMLAMLPKPRWLTAFQKSRPALHLAAEGILILTMTVISLMTIVSESFNPFIYFRF